VGSVVFAQDDLDAFDTSSASSAQEESSENEGAYYGPKENSSASTESAESSAEEESAVYTAGSADASNDEWAGFHYEDVGLTQWEFQQAKESGMTRDKLNQLVELGIRPSEYIQEPWKRLGVTEEAWLSDRASGLEDSDIDRTYKNHAGDQSLAFWSLLVPSLYQWNHDESIKAIWMDALWVVGVGGLSYFAATAGNDDNTWVYWLIPVLGAHVWSFADAFFSTQWANNPDANRFSLGIGPSLNRGVAGLLQVRF